MKKSHARPSKRFVCGRCKRRIRWAPKVHRAGGRGQLIWCEECWSEARNSNTSSARYVGSVKPPESRVPSFDPKGGGAEYRNPER